MKGRSLLRHVGLGVTLLACLTPPPAAAAGGVLRMNVSSSDISSVDPAIGSDAYSGQIVLATCARLVGYPDVNGRAGDRIVPDAAVALPLVSEDGLVYTFRVRRGWRFSDGSPLTAASFRRAYERALTPSMRAYAANFLQDIVGAKAMLAGKTKRLRGVTANGDTLTVKLAAPAPDFLARATLTALCAVRADSPVDPRGMNAPAAAGPYYVTRHIPNKLITLKRNPYYGGSRPHRVDEIDITTNTNQQASLLEVQRGDADYDPVGIPAAAGATLAKKFGINRGRYFVTPFLETDYIAFNTKRKPFTDLSVRRAVNFALNRRAIATQIGLGAASPTDQILPPGMPGFADAKLYPLERPDVARAKALLGGRTLSARLYITNDPAAVNEAEVIKANLAAVGIRVTVKSLTFAALINVVGHPTEPYDMVLLGWAADYADPDDFINVTLSAANITPSNNINLAQFDDPAFQRRMDAAEKLSGARRIAAYRSLDRDLMARAAPWAPVANRVSREFVSARVGCYVAQDVFPQLDLAAVCLK